MLIELDRLDLSPHRPKGHVPRPSAALIRRLRRHGVVECPVVRPSGNGRYEVLTGFETVVACGRLRLDTVPCAVREDLGEAEAAEIARDHAKKAAGEGPVEFAESIASAIGRQPRRGAIAAYARQLGVSRAKVANALRIFQLPEEVLDHLRRGDLTMGYAKAILAAPLAHQRCQVAAQAIQHSWTVAETQAAANRLARGQNSVADAESHAPATDPDQARFEQAVSQHIGCPFTLDGQGRAVINYFGDADILTGVLEKLGYREW